MRSQGLPVASPARETEIRGPAGTAACWSIPAARSCCSGHCSGPPWHGSTAAPENGPPTRLPASAAASDLRRPGRRTQGSSGRQHALAAGRPPGTGRAAWPPSSPAAALPPQERSSGRASPGTWPTSGTCPTTKPPGPRSLSERWSSGSSGTPWRAALPRPAVWRPCCSCGQSSRGSPERPASGPCLDGDSHWPAAGSGCASKAGAAGRRAWWC
mmetsp:Transcript_4747/g.13170  ORF Transcript_4747/g.13170 Transcript_4747/m.13170 type:complete len:214 (+) Transcript_4747:754-1395(+)